MVDKIWYNMEELIGGSEERGINRNILECKASRDSGYWIVTFGINRNILECKAVFACVHIHFQRVLIETYWNVKSGKYTNAYFVGHVLIETYWNVKKETKVIDKSSIKY